MRTDTDGTRTDKDKGGDAMRCIMCGYHSSVVTDTRLHDDGDESYIRRLRKCLNCDRRWATREAEESELPKRGSRAKKESVGH